MKKGKLLILIAALLCFSLLFVACADPQEGEETESAMGDANANPEDMTVSTPAKQEEAKHEIHNYFDLVSEKEDLLLSTASRIDGELISYDEEHNLAVIRKTDIDLQNMVNETWRVYDLKLGTIIHTEQVSYPYMADDTERENITISLEYPVIRVERDFGVEDDEANGLYTDSSVTVSYYLAREGDDVPVYTTDDEDFAIYRYQNGLVCVKMGDKMFWIDKNLEIVRTVETIFANGYDVEAFNSEYKGYLYSWTGYDDNGNEIDSDELLVFNREGRVSARYLAGNDSFIRVFVLNNGNAFVQEYTVVSIYDSYDFVLNGTRYKVKSSIVDHITGKTEEVDPGFVVTSLTSKYYQGKNDEDHLVLKNADNYAYVYNYANGYIAKGASLCVLDNTLAKLFTLENETYGVDFGYGVYAIRDDLYVALVSNEGRTYSAIFNLKGELISYVNTNAGMTDTYIVSDTTVYDYNMNPVFDISGNGMTYVDICDNAIYLSYDNFQTGAVEYYVIHSDSKKPELFADGIKYSVSDVGNGYYVLYDIERDAYVAYNSNGEELITSHERFVSEIEMSDVRLFKTTFNGEPIVYVVK